MQKKRKRILIDGVRYIAVESLPYEEVLIGGKRYIPIDESSIGHRDLKVAIVGWFGGSTATEARLNESVDMISVQVNDYGEGVPLLEFVDDIVEMFVDSASDDTEEEYW